MKERGRVLVYLAILYAICRYTVASKTSARMRKGMDGACSRRSKKPKHAGSTRVRANYAYASSIIRTTRTELSGFKGRNLLPGKGFKGRNLLPGNLKAIAQ